jgi:hypothetical protein
VTVGSWPGASLHWCWFGGARGGLRVSSPHLCEVWAVVAMLAELYILLVGAAVGWWSGGCSLGINKGGWPCCSSSSTKSSGCFMPTSTV